MSIEEKLQKCIEFIRRLERGDMISDVYVNAKDPCVNGDFQCDECGSYDIIGSTCVRPPNKIKDAAWHLLADIDGL